MKVLDPSCFAPSTTMSVKHGVKRPSCPLKCRLTDLYKNVNVTELESAWHRGHHRLKLGSTYSGSQKESTKCSGRDPSCCNIPGPTDPPDMPV